MAGDSDEFVRRMRERLEGETPAPMVPAQPAPPAEPEPEADQPAQSSRVYDRPRRRLVRRKARTRLLLGILPLVGLLIFGATAVFAIQTLRVRNDPATVTKQFYDALSDHDLATMKELVCDAQRPSLDDPSVRTALMMVEFDNKDSHYETVGIYGDRATVRISGKTRAGMLGFHLTDSTTGTNEMAYERGSWRWCPASSGNQ